MDENKQYKRKETDLDEGEKLVEYFDATGRIIQKITINKEGDVDNMVDYSYAKDGGDITRLVRDGSGNQISLLVYEWDKELGKKKSLREYNEINNWIYTHQYTYENDDKVIDKLYDKYGEYMSESIKKLWEI